LKEYKTEYWLGGLVDIEIITLDSTKDSFETEFAKYKQDFMRILSSSYSAYYGDDYQTRRIVEGKSVIFLALVDNILVGVSYIKNNGRRGGTAIFPEQYRRMGIGEKLVKESLKLIPRQYSILRANNYPMISLMEKLGFKKAKSIEDIRSIVQDEFSQLSNFEFSGDYLVFNRKSLKRGKVREQLTLLHTY
jgi:hypothetical protein